jgi:hypothetical protein
MGTVTARSVLRRVGVLLHDTSFVHWTESELLDYLCDGQREAVIHKPSAFVRQVEFVCAAGTLQTLPVDANTLVDIPCNTNGPAISVTARTALDSLAPDWHQHKADPQVLHFCYNPQDPKHFYVYPRSPGGNRIQLSYNAVPPDIGIDAPLTLDDLYVGALVDYVIYRAYSKDSEHAAHGDAAQRHYGAFLTSLVGKTKAT